MMGTINFRMWNSLTGKCVQLLIILAVCDAFPNSDDDRFGDREIAGPGAHQLASWIISQLRQNNYVPAPEIPVLPYRLPMSTKRNSELTSSIMGIPRTMIDNGRK